MRFYDLNQQGDKVRHYPEVKIDLQVVCISKYDMDVNNLVSELLKLITSYDFELTDTTERFYLSEKGKLHYSKKVLSKG